MNAPETAKARQQGWQASLNITLERRGLKTVMSELHHFGPLRVQRPFYPEGLTSHIYLLHPPGGVVGGDGLNIRIHAREKAHGLFTTPGATKFYRSAGATAVAVQQLRVSAGSALEWFPQENIVFPGARVKMNTRVDIEPGAVFMGWEISCLGRPVNSDYFRHGEVDACFSVYRDDRPFLIERLRVIRPEHLNATSGLRNYPMQGLFVATGADDTSLDDARLLLEQAQAALPAALPAGITLLDDMLVLRVLGDSTEKIQSLMIPVWQMLRRHVLKKEAVIPRIWNT